MTAKKSLISALIIILISWIAMRLFQGAYYYLEPKERDVYASIKKTFLYDGEMMKITLAPITERVIINPYKLFQDPTQEASSMIIIWVPEKTNAEVRIKEILLKGSTQELSFQTGLCDWDYWNGKSFKTTYDWKKATLEFPRDGSSRGIYKVAYIGMNHIKLRQSKDKQYELKLIVEATNGDKVELFDKSYAMTKRRSHLGFIARMLMGAK